MNKKIKEKTGISPELIFIILVLAALLGAYYMGKAKHGAIASHKGTSINWLANDDEKDADESSIDKSAVKHKPRHSVKKILAMMDEIGGAGALTGNLSQSDVVDDLSALSDETGDSSLRGREYAFLNQTGSDGSMGNQQGTSGSNDGASSDKPTSESAPVFLASLASPSLWGYGGGGGGGNVTITVDCSLCCCECGDPCCNKDPEEANMELAYSEGSDGEYSTQATGGIDSTTPNPGDPDEPGTYDPPGDPRNPPLTNPVPEPASVLMLCLGLAGIGAARFHKVQNVKIRRASDRS